MNQRAILVLRKRLQRVTLTLGLQDYQRNAIMREFDEWVARELGRAWRSS